MFFSFPHDFYLLLFRLGLAFVIGAAIGFEREMRGQAAGLRTHILVCLGSCLLAIVDSVNPYVQGKIAAQVVTGVGFLGAGTILRSDRGVQSHGLTTAASIWCTAAIGIALGYGGISIWMAISTSVILFITLTILGWFESIALDKQKHKILNFSVIIPDPSRESNIPGTIVSSLVQSGIHINSMTTDPPDPNSPTRLIHLNINLQGKEDSDAIALLLSSNPLVKEFNWSK